MLEHCSLVEGSFLNVSSYHKLGNFQLNNNSCFQFSCLFSLLQLKVLLHLYKVIKFHVIINFNDHENKSKIYLVFRHSF